MLVLCLVSGGMAWIWTLPLKAVDISTPAEVYGIPLPGIVVVAIFWGLFLFLLALTAAGLIGVVRSFQAPSTILIDDTSITLPPRPIFRRTKTIGLDDIGGMRIHRYRGTTSLILEHTGGRLNIDQRSLASGVRVEDIVQAIEERRTH